MTSRSRGIGGGVGGGAGVTPPPPSQGEMDEAIHVIHDHADRVFLWDYERNRAQLVTLYNKAMGSQWNSVTDLDWATDVDPERLVAEQDSPMLAVARVAGRLPGSPLATWSEKEYSQLGIEFFTASLSQFMHGEQGAMMTAAKIVETVPWIDAKYYASTQTMDEARHTEVFAKYLSTKLGEAYPMSPFLKAQIWSLLEDSRWDIAYLGMQIVIESLALAAFGDMLRRTQEPLLKKLLRYVMSDEARHVAFGVLTLSEFYADLSQAELKERQEFMVDATLNSRVAGDDARGVGAHGDDGGGSGALHRARRRRVQGQPDAWLPRGFFAKLVPNTRKLGLLDANGGYLRERWGEAGLLEFEFADDTGSDYEAYDAVAADRMASAAAAAEDWGPGTRRSGDRLWCSWKGRYGRRPRQSDRAHPEDLPGPARGGREVVAGTSPPAFGCGTSSSSSSARIGHI